MDKKYQLSKEVKELYIKNPCERLKNEVILTQSLGDHFKRLDKESKQFRFYTSINEAFIENYSQKLNMNNNYFIGWFDCDSVLRGVSHISATKNPYVAEIGLSLEKPFRGQGIGVSLLVNSVLLAKELQFNYISIECLASNYNIISWVKRAGFPLERKGCELHSLFSTNMEWSNHA